MNKSQFEDYLNELYADYYSLNDVKDKFCYLNNGKIRNSTIEHAYNNHRLGTLFRKHDPIAFNVAFNEHGRKRFWYGS